MAEEIPVKKDKKPRTPTLAQFPQPTEQVALIVGRDEAEIALRFLMASKPQIGLSNEEAAVYGAARRFVVKLSAALRGEKLPKGALDTRE